MSVLAIDLPTESAFTDAPRILSFLDTKVPSPSSSHQDIVTRARLLHRNATCRHCGRATVETIELDDALLNRWGATIPGTATVVGFTCSSCRNEWSTENATLRIHA